MERRINLISLFLFLLKYQIEATSNTKSTPPNIENLPLKNFQKVISNCEAIREVFDHEGGAAGFTSNCVIKVWNDQDSLTDLKDLTPEQQEKLKSELNGQAPQKTDQANIDQIKLLQEEATNRHYMCMEAKRSILHQLKLQLPAGLKSCDKINQVLNDLKLSPLLEEFIKKVSGPMKEIVARIHALEQDTQMSESDKLEAIRKEKSELTRLLDEDCKDDHPSIRFHNISYLPSAEMQKLKMTLVVTHPDKKIEFFNLPPEEMGPQVDYLRSMTQAAAHHFEVTGQTGPFKAHLMSAPRSQVGLDSAPGVISFVPADKGGSFTADNSQTVKNILSADRSYIGTSNNQVNQLADISPSISTPVNEQVTTDPSTSSSTHSSTSATHSSTSAFSEPTAPIAKYWNSILVAQDDFAKKIKAMTEGLDLKNLSDKKTFDSKVTEESDALNNLLISAVMNLMDDSKLSVISDPPTEAAINKRYQDSKALLKIARDYMPSEKKSFFNFLSRSQTQSLPEKMYQFSKMVIKRIRDDDIQLLKTKKAAYTVPVVISGTNLKSDVGDNAASSSVDDNSTSGVNTDTSTSTSTPAVTTNSSKKVGSYWTRLFSGFSSSNPKKTA